jgi:CheY-like chemotaxis protein
MNDFVLLGHDNPVGRYPAPVIPIGQLNGELVAVYEGDPTRFMAEPIDQNCLYVSHSETLQSKLKDFNYRTDRLFAYGETDVTCFSSQDEKSFLKEFLTHSTSDREHSFLRFLLAKQTGDLALIVAEMGFCSEILLEEAPTFAQEWCAQELLDIYPQINPHRSGGAAPLDRNRSEGQPKPLILLADDDTSIVDLYRQYLESAGFAISVAYDGDEALEKIRREMPQLVLLDLLMPKKSGTEVLAELHRDPSLKEIPVIVMTGGPLDVSPELPANMFLQKGNFNFADLKSYAERLLANRRVG